MGLVTDVWNGNAWGLVELDEDIVQEIEYRPQLLGGLDIFSPIYSRSKTIAIAKKGRELSLIPTSERGAPIEELIPAGSDVRPFNVSRLAKGSTVYADELQGVVALPFDQQTREIVTEVTERSAQIMDDMELTWEHMRLGAVQGVVYDADGTTPIINWYTEWDIPQPGEINFELGNANTDVRKKCRDVKRAMMKAAKGVWTPATRVVALVGDTFFDLLVNHPQIKETKLGTDRAATLEGIEGYSSIEIEGITFINYRGTDDDSKLAIDTNRAKFFPVGARGAFKVGFGPASEFKPYTNQRGREYFSFMLEDKSGRDEWDRVELYSYPLFICTRPEMLQRAKAA